MRKRATRKGEIEAGRNVKTRRDLEVERDIE